MIPLSKSLKVLIFTKRSAYQAYFQEYQGLPIQKLLRSGDKGLLHIRRTHSAHYETLRHVKKTLKAHKLPFEVRFRGQKFDARRYDLVITVGGDGTFLEASQGIRDGLILGVNSDPNHSVGNFTVSDRERFAKNVESFLLGKYFVEKLNRLEARVGDKLLPIPALNEILVSHASPAAMSHYVLKVGSVSERQRSSGVWISTAVGSTAAARSAGGKVLPKHSRSIQYVPRELFDGHGVCYKLKGGILTPGRSVTVISQMQEGMIYMDGSHHSFAFRYGQELKVSCGPFLRSVHFKT